MPLTVEIVMRSGAKAIPATDCRQYMRRLGEEMELENAVVSVLFCKDPEMAELNGKFRERARPTDVLSFPAGESSGSMRQLGDIAISTETASRQARTGGRSLEREIFVLLTHGLLHLLGYDHEVDDGEMMRLQRSLTQRMLPATRPARAS